VPLGFQRFQEEYVTTDNEVMAISSGGSRCPGSRTELRLGADGARR
jgi:hypothetical protein